MNASLATEGGWGETCAARGSDSSGKTAVTKIRSEQESFMIFLVLAGQQVAWVAGAINIHVRAGVHPRWPQSPEIAGTRWKGMSWNVYSTGVGRGHETLGRVSWR